MCKAGVGMKSNAATEEENLHTHDSATVFADVAKIVTKWVYRMAEKSASILWTAYNWSSTVTKIEKYVDLLTRVYKTFIAIKF